MFVTHNAVCLLEMCSDCPETIIIIKYKFVTDNWQKYSKNHQYLVQFIHHISMIMIS